jgi:hypothetical protein
MTPIIETVEVDRTPEEAFSYVTDPSRFGEWQQGVVGGHMEDDGQARVGSKCITTRRIGFAERPSKAEVTALSPPRTWAVHGIDGPIRATVNVTVDPSNRAPARASRSPSTSRGTGSASYWCHSWSAGKPKKEMPMNLKRLKQRLESGA